MYMCYILRNAISDRLINKKFDIFWGGVLNNLISQFFHPLRHWHTRLLVNEKIVHRHF